MTISKTIISGLFEISTRVLADTRGRFVKIFESSLFKSAHLMADFAESYYSVSHKNVIRGMHFQTPPYDHAKLVYVPVGSIQDVVLDIRKKSPTFGKFFATELSARTGNALYIPAGCAHGFCSLEDDTVVIYTQTSEYAPNNDRGIHYRSFGCQWKNTTTPIVSDRDLAFPNFSNWESPF